MLIFPLILFSTINYPLGFAASLCEELSTPTVPHDAEQMDEQVDEVEVEA